MTCEDVQRNTRTTDPLDQTAALCAAVVAHVIGCQTCRDHLRAGSARFKEHNPAGHVVNRLLTAADAQRIRSDPEAGGIIEKAKREHPETVREIQERPL